MVEIRSINALRAEKEDDNNLLSPVEALEDAAEDIRSGKVKCNKLLIISLDTGDGYDYDIQRWMSHLQVSEAVALMEAVKYQFMKDIFERDAEEE